MGMSSVCVGGDHICDCEGDWFCLSVEPREGPPFSLPSHCTLVLRTGKRGGQSGGTGIKPQATELARRAQGPQGLSDEAALRLGLER